MKLRMKGDSLRLRVSPSELSRLLQSGRIEETVHFGPQADAKLTYALLASSENPVQATQLTVRYQSQEIAVVVSIDHARSWAENSDVGLYANISFGAGQLELAIEKDFACLDKDEAENQDTFPNPNVSC